MRNKQKVLNFIKSVFLMSIILCTTTLGSHAKPNESESGTGGSIGGFLWLDEDGNDILTSEERKIQGYTVSLYQYGNLSKPIDTTSTNSEGKYLFEDIVAGDYIIAIQQDEYSECIPSKTGTRYDNYFSYELNSTRAYTPVISLKENETKEEINCAMICKESGEDETISYKEESERERLSEDNNCDNSISLIERSMTSTTDLFHVYKGDGTTLIAQEDTLDAAVDACKGDLHNNYVIKANADVLDMGPCVTIPEDKKITITSAGKEVYTITQTALTEGGGTFAKRHFCVYGGTLILKNITLKGSKSENDIFAEGGGVWVRNGGSLYVEDAAVIKDCGSKASGAGVYLYSNSEENDKLNNQLFINGGTISGNWSKMQGGGIYSAGSESSITINSGKVCSNTAENGGGGISLDGTTFKMNGGFITENKTNNSNKGGGGILLSGSSMHTMEASINGGEISKNYSAGNGGGLYCDNYTLLTMCEGIIDKNAAAKNGGGVYVSSTHVSKAEFVMTSGSITKNTATEGGGIYTSDKQYMENPEPRNCYRNIGIGNAAIVSGNIASNIYFPPSSYQNFEKRINNPFNGLLLDNYNINYVYDNSLSYGILYNANYQEREEHYFQITLNAGWQIPLKVLPLSDTGFIAKENFRFIKWNTQPDGSGDDWSPGIVYKSTRSRLILYAIWERESYSVTEKFVNMEGTAVDSELYKDRKVPVNINGLYSLSDVENNPIPRRITNSVGDKYDYIGYCVSEAEYDSKAVLTEGTPETFNVTADTNIYFVYRLAVDNFTFYKIDGLSGNALEGAVFELYEWSSENDYDPESGIMAGDNAISWLHRENQISSVNGKVTFNNLGFGKYMLVETLPPTGYQLPHGQWLLDTTVNPIKITAVTKNAASPPPLFRTSEERGKTQGELILPNYKSMVMPTTGGIGGIISTMSGIVLAGIGIIFILYPIKQNKKYKSFTGQSDDYNINI